MKNLSVVLFFFSALLGFSQIETYQPSSNINDNNPYIFSSPYYKVELSQGNLVKESFVYAMNAMHNTNNSKSTSWINFSFKKPVNVKVTVLYKDIDFSQVLPRKLNIVTEKVTERSVEFTITETGHYSVEFEEGIVIEHPLLIFANPLEEDVPNKMDEDVIYFESGYHEIGDNYIIPSNKTVYIEGGAYIKGQFAASDANSIKIRGRGIVSGEDYPARTHNHMIQMNDVKDVEIEGITIIHSPKYMIALRGENHYLHNIKMMGWWFSTDGISAGENTIIENCFFKVNDDAVKLYKSNTIVRNCVIWQLENGAPFMISWNGSRDFGNVHVHDIEIIRVEHHWDNENLAVVCAVHGGRAHISNFLIENIVIDNSKWRLFHLVTRPNRWGKWNTKEGSLSDMIFKNIYFHNKQEIPSLIMGHDKNHPIYNLSFENIIHNRKKITADGGFFIIDPETTKNIKVH